MIKILICIICLPLICLSTDIRISLSDAVVESDRSFFVNNFEPEEDAEGRTYYSQRISRSLGQSLSLSDFMSDKENYHIISQSLVSVHSPNEVKISFDDNNDEDYTNDRAPINTKLNNRIESYLVYAHKGDMSKNIKIPCTYLVTNENQEYVVKVFFSTMSNGKFSIDNKKYKISFWKSMYTDIHINNSGVTLNNPIRINRKFYQISKYDPVQNYLILSLLDNQKNLTGTLQGLYVDKSKLEKAFNHHGISFPKTDDENQYHVFYFWGHWCHPCLKSMSKTCQTLKALNNKFSIYNISYDVDYSDDSITIINDIINNYGIPGIPILEYYSKHTSSESPIIKLLNNISYPGYIICDKNLKIIYRSDSSDKSLEEFIAALQ